MLGRHPSTSRRTCRRLGPAKNGSLGSSCGPFGFQIHLLQQIGEASFGSKGIQFRLDGAPDSHWRNTFLMGLR